MTCVVTPIIKPLTDVGSVWRERRRVGRRALNLRVDIALNDGMSRSFTGKNIGMGGVFLCADPSQFQLGDIIKPRFFLNYNGFYKPCCVVVQVMHVNTDGVGVCFHQYDGSLFRSIYKMMYEPIHKASDEVTDSVSEQFCNAGLPQVASLSVVSGKSKYQ